MRKKLLSIILSLAMVLTMVPMMGSVAYAADTDLQNVNLAADGTLTWDAFEGAKYYDIIISNFNVLFEDTSCNLAQILEDHGKKSGNYTVEIYAKDKDYIEISAPYYVNYTYTARNPQLATPTNFTWSGTTVSWDSVENAEYYYVYVYEDSFHAFYIGSPTVYENKVDIAPYLYEGTYDYGICVVAKAEGYPDSEQGESDFKSLTKELPAMTGVSIASNGIMTWDAFSGAERYEISMSAFSALAEGTSADLNEILKSYGKPSGEYDVTIKALDSSYKQISKAWAGTYDYTAPAPLDRPANLVWSDRTISWAPVTNATSYQVLLFKDSYEGVATDTFDTTETSFEIPRKYLNVGTNYYGVWIKAFSDAYPSSEYAESELHPITYIKASIQNAKIEDGVLSWDAFTDAKDYIVEIAAEGMGITYTEATSYDVDAALKSEAKPSGTYSITLSARDIEGNSISTTTQINYHYVVKYDISVKSTDEEKGTVMGSGTYSEGDDVTIQAYPMAGYVFDYWTDKWGSVIDGAGKQYTFKADSSSSPEYNAWFKVCAHDNTNETVENIIPATTTADGSYDKVISCKDCNKEISRENVAISHIDSVKLSTTSYTYNGSVKSPSLTVKDINGNTLVKDTDYTVTTPSGRKNVGTYTYKATFQGKYSGTKSVSFKINPATAAIKSLTSGSRKMTVKMTTKPSSKGASTYQIYYKQKGTSTWKKTTTTSYYKTIKSLKKGKQYYVKVRAYKKVGTTTYYGAWSKTMLSKKIK